MKDDRFRVPLENAYAEALGRAVFIFARLEWDAVWICQKLSPGYINNLGVKTAGRIGRDLLNLVSALPNSAAFIPHCIEFRRLVDRRNRLLHGKPGSGQDGEQNLFDHGTRWTIEQIDCTADEFTACQEQLNHVLYGLP